MLLFYFFYFFQAAAESPAFFFRSHLRSATVRLNQFSSVFTVEADCQFITNNLCCHISPCQHDRNLFVRSHVDDKKSLMSRSTASGKLSLAEHKEWKQSQCGEAQPLRKSSCIQETESVVSKMGVLCLCNILLFYYNINYV